MWQQSNNNPEKDQYEGFNQHKLVFNMNQLESSKRGISYIYIYHIQGYDMGVQPMICTVFNHGGGAQI